MKTKSKYMDLKHTLNKKKNIMKEIWVVVDQNIPMATLNFINFKKNFTKKKKEKKNNN